MSTLSLTTIRTFNLVRARFQRPASGDWHAGWVTHLDHRSARIRMRSFVPLVPNELLLCRCYGDRTLASFEGQALAQAGQDVALEILGPVSFEPSKETVRLKVEGIEGTLREGDGEESILIVMDLSPRSLGGLTDRAFVPGTTLDVRLGTSLGEYEGTLRVVNCRKDETSGCYRLGMAVMDAPRLSHALWNRLISEIAG